MNLQGIPDRVIRRALDRLVKEDSGCWVWPGATASGYGRIGWRENGEPGWAAVHRIVYAHLKGPIPEGMDLDHLCHDPKTCTDAANCPHRRCSNPSHLEPVTRRENLERGGTIPARNKAITHCPAGHPYSPENTRLDKLGRRSCSECVRRRNRESHHRNRDSRLERMRRYRSRNIGLPNPE